MRLLWRKLLGFMAALLELRHIAVPQPCLNIRMLRYERRMGGVAAVSRARNSTVADPPKSLSLLSHFHSKPLEKRSSRRKHSAIS